MDAQRAVATRQAQRTLTAAATTNEKSMKGLEEPLEGPALVIIPSTKIKLEIQPKSPPMALIRPKVAMVAMVTTEDRSQTGHQTREAQVKTGEVGTTVDVVLETHEKTLELWVEVPPGLTSEDPVARASAVAQTQSVMENTPIRAFSGHQ